MTIFFILTEYKGYMRIQIDELCKIKGLSQEKLAEGMGISSSYLYALRAGTDGKRFNADHFKAMLKVFNCSVHDLFEDDVPMPRLFSDSASQMNEVTLTEVLTKFFELLDKEPEFSVHKSPGEISKLIVIAYKQALEEEQETGKPAEITKASLRGMLRLIK